MKRRQLPGPAAGRRIGLLGGSFNPAHSGHLHVAETALKRLRLDAVWWIVARGNPLKSEHGSFAGRVASARRITRGPAMEVSDIEDVLGLTYTIDTLRALKAAARDARFVWIIGADNAASFHRWKDWKAIAHMVPVAVVSRPGTRLSRALPFTRQFAAARLREADAACLPGHKTPAWVYLRGPDDPVSSTKLRRGG